VFRCAAARERLAAALPQRWAAAAPVVIVVAVDPRPCAARYGDRGEYLYSIQDTAAAATCILLMAVDRGLASCWIGAFDDRMVADALGITSSITPVAVLPVGYSAESSGKPARRPLDEVTTWL
jgi:nitroreductase